MSTATGPSVFERIIAREIPATIVFESDTVIAIKDIAPKAPVHLLVIPKDPQYADVVELAAGDPALLADMVATARRLADDPELFGDYPAGEFRLIFNTGEAVGQTVFHVHAHVMAGNLQEGSLA
ncbi:histidine triad nucleotide-binding protein [Frondihabitans australicus]|uniref:Histidine triad (HIT) family protein n=1 Tax=Frondihabitans australicus TaxID=386892 RepID=A0A495ID70_9MICO|nr:histidine triad nucleotide-binding protein [Frondihabitans australicus]RKR73902.1 histidine triad (HIT) family protein [Frondihabitans australicus]